MMAAVQVTPITTGGTVDRFNRSSPRPAGSSTILIDLPPIWMPQKRSRSPVRTHMPFLQP
jgi:hypothetical protein